MQYGQHTFLYTADEGRSLEGVVEYIRAAEFSPSRRHRQQTVHRRRAAAELFTSSSSSLRRERAAAIRLAAGGEAKLAKEVAACGSVNTQPAAARWINMAAFLNALMSNVIVTHLCDPVMSSDTLSYFLNLAYTVCQGCHTRGTQAGYQLS